MHGKDLRDSVFLRVPNGNTHKPYRLHGGISRFPATIHMQYPEASRFQVQTRFGERTESLDLVLGTAGFGSTKVFPSQRTLARLFALQCTLVSTITIGLKRRPRDPKVFFGHISFRERKLCPVGEN